MIANTIPDSSTTCLLVEFQVYNCINGKNLKRLGCVHDKIFYIYMYNIKPAFVKQNQLCDETDDCVYGEDERSKETPPIGGTGSPIDLQGVCGE